MFASVFNLGQQEVVDDFDDHRGADLGERKVARRQQRFVVDGIKRVVCQARVSGDLLSLLMRLRLRRSRERFCHAIQSARFAGV